MEAQHHDFWQAHDAMRRQAGLLLKALCVAVSARESSEQGPTEAAEEAARALHLLQRALRSEDAASRMESPVFSNREIEAAWLLLAESLGKTTSQSLRAEIAVCAQVMGASDNWSIVLRGSRQLRKVLLQLEPEARQFLLQAARAGDLEAVIAESQTVALRRFQNERRVELGGTPQRSEEPMQAIPQTAVPNGSEARDDLPHLLQPRQLQHAANPRCIKRHGRQDQIHRQGNPFAQSKEKVKGSQLPAHPPGNPFETKELQFPYPRDNPFETKLPSRVHGIV